MAALASCTTFTPSADIVLVVAGSPVDAQSTGNAYLYTSPSTGLDSRDGGAASQAWSMLGREDKAGQIDTEYGVSACPPTDPMVIGEAEVLERIVETAREHRVVIINESHVVTRHRDFSRKVIRALRPLGYSVLAAETFANVPEDALDPVEIYADLPFVERRLGYYSKESVFGAMLRDAKALGYRFVAYEQVFDPNRVRPDDDGDWRLSIRDRETAQAQNLAKLIQTLSLDEKLIVHVGYAHAREAVVIEKDGWESAWMAARLKLTTGIDPLTIEQTYCHGSADAVRLAQESADKRGWFDLYVDHPQPRFSFGRPDWRFKEGHVPTPIPQTLRPVDGPLVIEAFAEGDPFDAVPVDRIWIEPGEDVRLALQPGRYIVRAVRPVAPISAE